MAKVHEEKIEKIRSATKRARESARRPTSTLAIGIGIAGDGAPILDIDGERLRLSARCIASTLRTIADAYEDESTIVRRERSRRMP